MQRTIDKSKEFFRKNRLSEESRYKIIIAVLLGIAFILASIVGYGVLYQESKTIVVEDDECDDESCKDCDECSKIIYENLTMRIDCDAILPNENSDDNVTEIEDQELSLLTILRNDEYYTNVTLDPCVTFLYLFHSSWFSRKPDDIQTLKFTYEIKFNETDNLVYEVGYFNTTSFEPTTLFLVNTFGNTNWHNQTINFMSHPGFNLTANGTTFYNDILVLFMRITSINHWQKDNIEFCIDEAYIEMDVIDITKEDLENFY